MNVRSIESRDIQSILAIQSASPEVAQWKALDYSRVAHGEMAGWVAEDGNQLLGFLAARRVVEDIEILNFAVRADARRKGIGGVLLQAALAWGAAIHAKSAFLEVRASNLGALKFYEHRGFEITGRRPHYYVSPVEDALLLSAAIP